jgi:hypothetical protein
VWEPDYVTADELKTYLRVDDVDDADMMAIWITTASRAVDTYCHRQFGKVDAPEARTYSGGPCGYGYVVQIDDVQTALTSVTAGGVAVTDYDLEPVNGPQKGRPYTRLVTRTRGPLVVTAEWGWTAVPVPVKNATLIQAARLAARRDSPFGIAGSPTEGSELRLLAALDPDLKTSLGSKYRREWWAA